MVSFCAVLSPKGWCLFVLSFFLRGVLDKILNLIESVSEGFPSYSLVQTYLGQVHVLEVCD